MVGILLNLWDSFKDLMNYLIDWMSNWIGTVIHPGRMLDLALSVLQWGWTHLLSVLPTEMSTVLSGIAGFFSTGPVPKLFSAGLWIIDPLVSTTLLLQVTVVMMLIWAYTLIVRVVLIVKDHIWPGQ